MHKTGFHFQMLRYFCSSTDNEMKHNKDDRPGRSSPIAAAQSHPVKTRWLFYLRPLGRGTLDTASQSLYSIKYLPIHAG